MKRFIAVAAILTLAPIAAHAEAAATADPYDGFLAMIQNNITAATPIMLAAVLAMGGFAILKRIATTMFPSMKKGV